MEMKNNNRWLARLGYVVVTLTKQELLIIGAGGGDDDEEEEEEKVTLTKQSWKWVRRSVAATEGTGGMCSST
jgi:hypothetical protein